MIAFDTPQLYLNPSHVVLSTIKQTILVHHVQMTVYEWLDKERRVAVLDERKSSRRWQYKQIGYKHRKIQIKKQNS